MLGNGPAPLEGSGASLHLFRTNRARSPGYEYPADVWSDPAGAASCLTIFAPSVASAKEAASAVDGLRLNVLLVGDVLAPRDRIALIIDLLHRYVGHESV